MATRPPHVSTSAAGRGRSFPVNASHVPPLDNLGQLREKVLVSSGKRAAGGARADGLARGAALADVVSLTTAAYRSSAASGSAATAL